MTKILYMLVACVALAPAAILAAACLYMTAQGELEPEADRASGETMRFTTIGKGNWHITIHPRRWAALVVLFASFIWVVGIGFLLFVRTY